MDVAVAVGERHIGIDFEYDGARLVHGRHGVIRAQAQGKITVRVHGRRHGKHHVRTDLPALDQHGNFRKIIRDKIAPAALPASTRSAAEKQGRMLHMLDRVAIEIFVFAHRENLRHLDVAEIAPRRRQSMQQGWRLAHTGRYDDEVIVLHQIHRLLRRNALGGVAFLNGHGVDFRVGLIAEAWRVNFTRIV